VNATVLLAVILSIAATLVILNQALNIKGWFDLRKIRRLDDESFQTLVANLLASDNYQLKETRAMEETVQLILRNPTNEVLWVQCKYWRAGYIGTSPVHELAALIAGNEVRGCCVSLGKFTSQAQDLAKLNDIRLIDGKAFRVRMAAMLASQRLK